MVVVKKRWRCMLNVSWEKKYCSMTCSGIRVYSDAFERAIYHTSLHTNNSNGSVVNIFSPKQNLATLIKVSSCETSLEISYYKRTEECTYRREIIQDVTLRLIRKHPISRDRHRETADQRDERRHVRHHRKPVHCRRPQAPIDQQTIMMADECKANDTNRLKNPWFDDGEPLGRVALEEGRNERAFVDYGEDDDEHAAEGE